MPVSMAIAAPVSQWIGLTATFVIAGIVPVPIAAIAYFWAKLSADEIAHPLRDEPIIEVIATPPVVLEKNLAGGGLDQIGQVVDDR
jgi:hypothetical protein